MSAYYLTVVVVALNGTMSMYTPSRFNLQTDCIAAGTAFVSTIQKQLTLLNFATAKVSYQCTFITN